MKLKLVYILTIYVSIFAFFILLSTGFAASQNVLFFGNFNDYMADLFNPVIIVASNDPYDVITNTEQEYFYYGHLITNANRIYPPLAYMFFKIIEPLFTYVMGSNIMFAHYIMLLGAVLYILLLYNNVKGQNPIKCLIVISFLLSGIFMYSWERGNIIIHTAIFVAFFVFYYKSDNKYIRELALISLCVAVNLKITPVVLGLLLLQEKRYKEIMRCVLYCCVMFFLPLIYFEGGVIEQITKLLHNLKGYDFFYYRRGYPELAFITNEQQKYAWLADYSYLSILASIYALVSFLFMNTQWKKVALLLLFTYTISNTSALYIFMYFFIFITMFLSQEKYNKKDFLYLLLIIIMLNPLQIYINGFNISRDIILTAMMTMLLLLDFEGLEQAVDYMINKIGTYKVKFKKYYLTQQ